MLRLNPVSPGYCPCLPVTSDPGPIGFLGGTFDPIHFGHLRLALELVETCRLREARIIPLGTPPHRNPPHASTGQRVEMTRLALACHPELVLDEREAVKDKPGYTVDTLTELRSELGEVTPICLLMGADAFLELATWRRWQELFDLAHIVVGARPGFELGLESSAIHPLLKQEFSRRLRKEIEALHAAPNGAIVTVKTPLLDISASIIRSRLAKGESVSDLLPGAVLDYIRTNQLYIGG